METKNALVTGGTSGLGEYVAARLGEIGWTVTATGRRQCADRSFEGGGRVCHRQADFACEDDIGTLARSLPSPLDLVVLNAASYPVKNSVDELRSAFNVNCLAPYELGLAILSAQPPEHRLRMIVINSESIYHADDGSCIYAASKAALQVLTKGLAARCRGSLHTVSTLLLGPLSDRRKTEEVARVAAARRIDVPEVVRAFLRRSNPDLVVDRFIEYDSCFRLLMAMSELGPESNGMLCRLDGGSAGSLG